ncbi:MAG: ABC transporter permease [Lachnospiraceae bacterium]|nr:ABC transporter permease [Lachnospiraceae bacterium]
MDLLNKLTIKNLKLNKKRTIVTIVGILLSVALITAVASVFTSAIDSLIHYEKTEQGNFHVVFYDVPVNEISTFENNRSVESLWYTSAIGYARLQESKNEYKPYAYLSAFTKEAMKNLSVNLVEGRLPKNDREILITTHLRNNGSVKWQVGDQITLSVGNRVSTEGEALDQYESFTGEKSEKIVNTKEMTYTIVGRIERPASNIESYEAPGYTLITYTDTASTLGSDHCGKVNLYVRYTKEGLKKPYWVTANLLGIDSGLMSRLYLGKLDGDEETYQQAWREIERAKYQFDTNPYLIQLETDPLGENTIGNLSYVVMIVCCIIVFTSVFCIKNSFDISITEKIRQYGMLASIGTTRKQIKHNVFYEAFILGMIGIPLGMAVGFVASDLLMIISNHYIGIGKNLIGSGNVYLKFHFSWEAAVFSCLLGIITIFLSALRSARRASKISPIMAIRNSGEIKLKKNSIRCPKLIRKLFGIGGEISYKNIKRNKRKYRTTVISIIVSVFVFIALASFMNLAYREMKTMYSTYEYNLAVTIYGWDKQQELNQVEPKIKELEGIDCYAVLDEADFKLNDPKFRKEYVDTMKENHYYDSEEGFEESSLEKELFENYYLQVYSVGESSYKAYVQKLGLDYDEVKDQMILVNNHLVRVFANNPPRYEDVKLDVFQYKKGDTLSLTYEKNAYDEERESGEENGDIGDIENEIERKNDNKNDNKDNHIDVSGNIAYVTKESPFGLGDIGMPCLVVSEEYFQKIKNLIEDKTMSDNVREIYMMTDDATRVQEEVEAVLDETDLEYSINNVDEEVQSVKDFYILIGIFLYGFIIVISLIGVTNIFNTITAGMELRRREFAMLRSIGMTKKEFNRMIWLESIFLGVKSLFFGTLIGLILSYVIYLKLESELAYEPPLKAVVIASLSALVLIACIMNYSMAKINRQNTIETIRNENI